MRETEKIARLFEALQQGESWVGLNFEQVTAGVHAAGALSKTIAGGNNIWQLINHLIYWRKTVIIRLQGILATPPMPEFYLPEDQSEEAWKDTLYQFDEVYALLRQSILDFDAQQLDRPSPMQAQTYHQLLLGCLQHDAYHMGQMVLLKKMAAR